MGNCNRLNGGGNLRKKGQQRRTQRKTQKMKGGASSDLIGSEYQGQGPVVHQGTPYVGFDLNGNTSEVAGSYAPLASSSHQCGGKLKKQQRRKTQKQQQRRQRKTQNQQQKRQRKTQKQQRKQQKKQQKRQRK